MELLYREDFNLSPISINRIEANLYLGSLSAARDIATITKFNITHILTIDSCPLPRKILDLKHLTTKYVQLSDQPHEDLLSHLDDTYNFISEGLVQGAVLVHCYFGVSRSATLVIAFTMKKYQLTFIEALNRVKAQRSQVHPNQGFANQLILYHKMGFKVDPNNMKYKMFRLGIAADYFKRAKILPQSFMDLVKFDPGLTQTHPEPNVYRCKKCRRVLASESNLITHKIGGAVCRKTFFIEPLAWMNVTQRAQEKLYCPKCKAKVGSFSWIMACQCPCGIKVSPAFYLTASKVDFSNVVKNVEMTF